MNTWLCVGTRCVAGSERVQMISETDVALTALSRRRTGLQLAGLRSATRADTQGLVGDGRNAAFCCGEASYSASTRRWATSKKLTS